eukprot:Pgem_evm1s13256
MDLETQTNPRTFKLPKIPLYLTKGQCGVDDIPIINIPEDAKEIEIIINNLTPAAHVIHLHGNNFQVLHQADFEWCSLGRTD